MINIICSKFVQHTIILLADHNVTGGVSVINHFLSLTNKRKEFSTFSTNLRGSKLFSSLDSPILTLRNCVSLTNYGENLATTSPFFTQTFGKLSFFLLSIFWSFFLIILFIFSWEKRNNFWWLGAELVIKYPGDMEVKGSGESSLYVLELWQWCKGKLFWSMIRVVLYSGILSSSSHVYFHFGKVIEQLLHQDRTLVSCPEHQENISA